MKLLPKKAVYREWNQFKKDMYVAVTNAEGVEQSKPFETEAPYTRHGVKKLGVSPVKFKYCSGPICSYYAPSRFLEH